MKSVKALFWGLALATYLRFGLEPTGWLFYEASFLFGIDGLYWGYSIFRGSAHALSLWPFQNILCIGLGLLLATWHFRRMTVAYNLSSNENKIASKKSES
jgi:hypothetical protein